MKLAWYVAVVTLTILAMVGSVLVFWNYNFCVVAPFLVWYLQWVVLFRRPA